VRDDRLHLLLERAATLLRAEMRVLATEHGLKLAQLEALHYLGICNRYSDTPAALSEYLGATKGTVSQTLLSLERKGLISKVADACDKRSQHCTLTRAGRELFDSTFPSPVTQSASKNVERELSDALEAWLRRLQQERGHEPFGICRTCSHYRRKSSGGQCGLTSEPLSAIDSGKICREHLPVV